MILLIDNYDSFTYNLYQYLGEFENIKVFRNDEISVNEIVKMNPQKIVISPGPKTPDDAGICIEIIKNFYKTIPILGICLGHQCIGKAFGGEIVYAKQLCHGKTSFVNHNKKGLFSGLQTPIKAARYHSLAINKETLSKDFEITAETEDGEIMAISHKKYPLYGLQFHPESIYTKEGMKIIKNFVKGEENNA